MREAISNRVTIEDMVAEAFKQLLRYIYTAQLPTFDNSFCWGGGPQKYLPSVDRYDMPELKAARVAAMIRDICSENVIEYGSSFPV